jgi:hypothetical protein
VGSGIRNHRRHRAVEVPAAAPDELDDAEGDPMTKRVWNSS